MPQNEIYAALNVTQSAGVARLFKVLVKDRKGEDFTALGGGTYFGALRNIKTGEFVDFPVSVSAAESHVLLLAFPALSAGRWRYEVYVTAEGGMRDRIVCGLYSVLETVVDNTAAQAVTPYDATLVLGYDMEVLNAWFNATTRAEQAAAEARAVLDSVKESVDLLQGARYVVDTLQRSVREAFSIGANGNWYVGEVDTGKPSRGERGMNADEFQYHLISDASELPTDAEHCNPNHRYVVRGVQATAASAKIEYTGGVDWAMHGLSVSINGVSFVRYGGTYNVREFVAEVNAGQDLATLAWDEAYTFTVTARELGAKGNNILLDFSTMPDSGYDVRFVGNLSGGEDARLSEQYLWIDGAWVGFPLNAPQRATTQNDGLVKLSTDAVVKNGVPIGENAAGQLVADHNNIVIPDATTETAGKVTLAGAVADGGHGVVTAAALLAYLSTHLPDVLNEFKRGFKDELDAAYFPKNGIQVVDSLPEPRVEGVIYLERES